VFRQFEPTNQRRIENTASAKDHDGQGDAFQNKYPDFHLLVRRWVEHLLIRSPLVVNLLQKFMLCYEPFLDEQL
jgi:hypothetical protein